MAGRHPTGWPASLRPLQSDLPYDHPDDEEQDHQRQEPAAQALLLASHGQRRARAVALCRLPHPESIFFLRGKHTFQSQSKAPGAASLTAQQGGLHP